MKRTMSARGSETSCASGRPVIVRTPDRVRSATVTPALSRACRRSDAGRECRVRGRVAAVASAVDDERRQRRRLVDVEAGLPARADPEGIEPRLVGDHRSVDSADAPGGDVRRERGEIIRPERGVAVPAQPEVAVPDVAHERAACPRSRCGTGSRARAARAPRRPPAASGSRPARARARRCGSRQRRRCGDRRRVLPYVPDRRSARRAHGRGGRRGWSRRPAPARRGAGGGSVTAARHGPQTPRR